MLDDELAGGSNNPGEGSAGEGSAGEGGGPQAEESGPVVKRTVRRRTAKKVTVPEPAPLQAPSVEIASPAPSAEAAESASSAEPAESAPAAAPVVKRTTRKRTAKKATAAPAEASAPAEAPAPSAEVETSAENPPAGTPAEETPAKASGEAPVKKRPARKKAAKKAAEPVSASELVAESESASVTETEIHGGLPQHAEERAEKPKRKRKKAQATTEATADEVGDAPASDGAVAAPLFQAPVVAAPDDAPDLESPADEADDAEPAAPDEADTAAPEESGAGSEGAEADSGEDATGATGRRRRRRGGRRRRKGNDGDQDSTGAEAAALDTREPSQEGDAAESDADAGGEGGSSRRRRRRRRAGDAGDGPGDDPAKTVTRVRRVRSAEDEITAVSGSTRLEAKKQRRREGREAGRRRAPIVSEAEFLARRESVDRVMAVRQRDDVTQIAVLEDKVLVEHYVARESQTSLIGNVYLGRVQNVLPSMEAAFIDIGKGRNAVLYAGEVNWQSLGHKEGEPRKIESVLSSGQSILVQVTKDPIGHKGARLTSQVSLAGRFLVYVPDGTTSGISRKLPDTERARLKTLLKDVVPDSAGVIVRTAAEGAAEDELKRDVERLRARWEDIEAKIAKGNSPQLLYGEPDLTLKVVRDLFTEDFSRLVIDGDDAWETVNEYVAHVAPDLQERLERYDPAAAQTGGRDLYSHLRIDEQIHKGLDRKVWLPSGGSLVIDRTEAMTVVDVNTGKFTGSGGNLEETVTKNNLEAAEEIVRQLRLRDIGGIIVVDFIDMVLESNRDLVLRRLVECLGRDRTRHQVAEVTSLGLVQMTRKRIGTGLLEAFSETCEHCQGRGLVLHDTPVEPRRGADDGGRGRRGRRGRDGNGGANGGAVAAAAKPAPSPRDVALMARPAEPSVEFVAELVAESAAESAVEEEVEPAEAGAVGAESIDDELIDLEPLDAGPVDVGPVDAGPVDAGPVDAGPVSVGRIDAEPVDAEPADPVPVAAEPVVAAGSGQSELAEAAESGQSELTEAAVDPFETRPSSAPQEPSAPPTVTRGRRRAASRPAGPPSSPLTQTRVDHTEPAIAAGSSEEPEPEPEPEPVGHVPVKKRGTRKR